MRGGTLFSGVGAPEAACPEIDWRWCAEIDPFACAVLASRHPSVRNLGDVNRIDVDAVEPVDLVVFGSPCQSFSVAGKRLGLDDPRGNMALVGLRVVGRIRPRWVVWENVPGVLSSDNGRDFGAFLGLLGKLGYGFAYRVLDARHFGVPQRRRRVFVVGCLGDWRGAAAVLFEPESLRGDSPPRREAGERIAGTIAPGAHPGGFNGRDADTADNLIAFGGNNTAGPIDVATACNAHGSPRGRLDFESETFVTHSLRADSFDAGEDGTGRGTPLVCGTVRSHPRPGSNSVGATAYGIRSDAAREGSALTPSADAEGRVRLRDPGFNLYEETAPTLDNAPHSVAFDTTQITAKANYSNPKPGDPCHPLARTAHPPAIAGMSVRRLTPRECERLQGFEDDWTAISYRGKPAADGPRYRAIGNSMAVPVVRWIGQRIQAFDCGPQR